MKASKQNCHEIQFYSDYAGWRAIEVGDLTPIGIFNPNNGFYPYSTAVNTMMLLQERYPDKKLRIEDVSSKEHFKKFIECEK